MGGYRLRPDVRLIRRAGDVGLGRGRVVAWLPPALAHRLWAQRDGSIDERLASPLAVTGLLEPAQRGLGANVDRNVVFASALCDLDGPRALRTLRETELVLVGCGGIGSNLAVLLASVGAGRLTLVDDDAVEASNLNRLLWATPSDIGRAKVVALAAHLESRFGVAARVVNERASPPTLERMAHDGRATWVVAVDRAPAAREVSHWLHRVRGARYVHAGYAGALCMVGPFVAGAQDPCPFCGSRAYEIVGDGFVAPSAAPNNFLIAAFLAAQLLVAAGGGVRATRLHATRWTLDLRSGSVEQRRIDKAPNCEVCG
jgi:hypothetical protein